MEIGVNAEEKGIKQRVIVNVSVEPVSWPNPSHDNISETVSYDNIVQIVRWVSTQGHIHLVETVADRIAEACLQQLPIRQVMVRVEKPDIYGFAIPGIEIIRKKWRLLGFAG
jgi:dihydroneopterin aldolase